MRFPIYQQLDAMDCGPTCLRMVAKYYGRTISLDYLRNKSQYGKEGVSLLGLADTADSIGLKSIGAKLTFEKLIHDAPLPAILHWDQYHFVVLTPQSSKRKLVIADPAKGRITLTKEEFLEHWGSTTENGVRKGIALLIERTPAFKEQDFTEIDETGKRKIGWRYLFNYLVDNKKGLFQVGLGMLIGSAIQLVFPYLTQSIVDTGINTQNLNFIEIVLAAEMMLLFS